MPDLCSLEDVKFFGRITGPDYDARIAQMITYMSDDIIRETEKEDLTADNHDANRACIYGVLLWLEKDEIIVSTNKNISSVKEGDISITYSESSSTRNTLVQSDNSDSFNYYMSRLLPTPSAGVLIDLEDYLGRGM